MQKKNILNINEPHEIDKTTFFIHLNSPFLEVGKIQNYFFECCRLFFIVTFWFWWKERQKSINFVIIVIDGIYNLRCLTRQSSPVRPKNHSLHSDYCLKDINYIVSHSLMIRVIPRKGFETSHRVACLVVTQISEGNRIMRSLNTVSISRWNSHHNFYQWFNEASIENNRCERIAQEAQ